MVDWFNFGAAQMVYRRRKMLMRITFQIAGVFLISRLTVERNVLLHSGYIAIFVMIKSKTRRIVIMMMFNQSRTSMNAPENKGDSYQH
tara:strand:+ start:720 stop:983 length:264 start_codon:yes stop_codon:yes gene_type:complete